MASSAQGRRITEAARKEQLAIRAAFLREYVSLWAVLDAARVDETGAAWVRAVMPELAKYREESAAAAERYYAEFRQAEAPQAEGPAPTVERASSSTTRRQPRQSGRRTADPVRGSQGRSRRGRVVAPRIVWDDADKAARTSLAVTGPANIKSKTRRGTSPEEAARQALVESGGSAARHVLTGGRAVHLELVNADPVAIGWARVTDGDPCAFCAMLASRGPRYKSEQSASRVVSPKAKRAIGDKYHDNCACIAEAVFSQSQAWPGRGREFQALWRKATGGYSGDDAINAFRRAYERGLREAQREAG